MNRSQLKKEIIADEGMVKHIYEDHLGYPTFGVGHLITEKDPEWKKSLGTEVSEERVHECLEKDLDIVLKEAFSSIPSANSKYFFGIVSKVFKSKM